MRIAPGPGATDSVGRLEVEQHERLWTSALYQACPLFPADILVGLGICVRQLKGLKSLLIKGGLVDPDIPPCSCSATEHNFLLLSPDVPLAGQVKVAAHLLDRFVVDLGQDMNGAQGPQEEGCGLKLERVAPFFGVKTGRR